MACNNSELPPPLRISAAGVSTIHSLTGFDSPFREYLYKIGPVVSAAVNV